MLTEKVGEALMAELEDRGLLVGVMPGALSEVKAALADIAFRIALEAAVKVAENEKIIDMQNSSNFAYNVAVGRCAAAIRALISRGDGR